MIIAFNFIKVTANLPNAIRFPKSKNPMGRVHTSISLTVLLVRAQISITLPKKQNDSKFKPPKTSSAACAVRLGVNKE